MKYVRRFFELEKSDKIIFFLLLTTLGNLFMSLIKFYYTFTLPSMWFFINAIFNSILVILRLFSIRDYQNMKMEKDDDKKIEIGYKNYLNNGIILLLLGISYFMVSAYLYYKNPLINMHEYMTYLVAFIAFYSISSAIYGMCKYRKNHSPIISAVKVTNFANALTSIVLTQVVLLDFYGNGIDARLFNGGISMLVSIVIMILGLYMILGIKKYMIKE